MFRLLLKLEKNIILQEDQRSYVYNFLLLIVFRIQTGGFLYEVRDEAEEPTMPGVVI